MAQGGQPPQNPAGQVPAPVVQRLDAMTNLLNAQSIAQIVQPFSGEPRNFRGWMKEVEKFGLLSQSGDQERINVAYQTAKGVVSDFIARYLETKRRNRVAPTWADLKYQLGFFISWIIVNNYRGFQKVVQTM